MYCKIGSDCALQKVFVVGKRIDIKVPDGITFNSPDDMHQSVEHMRRCGQPIDANAQDYFFVSPDIWDWHTIPEFVMGGIAADNWLVSKANNMGLITGDGRRLYTEVITVDATKTITCIHQEHPNFSHNGTNRKSPFNLQLAQLNGGLKYGTVEDTQFYTERLNGEIVLRERLKVGNHKLSAGR